MTKKLKILSWNVNGIRAVTKKGFHRWLKKEDPDILCIQETKAHPEQLEDHLLTGHGYISYWNSAVKKGYSSTAIFSKIEPISVTNDIGIKEHDQEGRVITAEFEMFYLVNVYVPNSGRGLVRLDYRKNWDRAFLKFLKNLEKKKLVVVCGDFNVAYKEIDLANPKSNYDKTAGFTQVEIDGFQAFIDAGFVDTFREFEKGPGHYTFWAYWNNLRKRNIGWRIDYFLVTSKFLPKIKKSFILPDVMGSDHCPVGIELEQ